MGRSPGGHKESDTTGHCNGALKGGREAATMQRARPGQLADQHSALRSC